MFMIIGCGRLGGAIAQALSDSGKEVMVIDHLRENINLNLPHNFRGRHHIGMEIDTEVLRKAGIERAESVMCLSRDENTNMMAADVARMLFHVRNVIVRIDQPELAERYRANGFDVISPLGEATRALVGLLDHQLDQVPPGA